MGGHEGGGGVGWAGGRDRTRRRWGNGEHLCPALFNRSSGEGAFECLAGNRTRAFNSAISFGD